MLLQKWSHKIIVMSTNTPFSDSGFYFPHILFVLAFCNTYLTKYLVHEAFPWHEHGYTPVMLSKDSIQLQY